MRLRILPDIIFLLSLKRLQTNSTNLELLFGPAQKNFVIRSKSLKILILRLLKNSKVKMMKKPFQNKNRLQSKGWK